MLLAAEISFSRLLSKVLYLCKKSDIFYMWVIQIFHSAKPNGNNLMWCYYIRGVYPKHTSLNTIMYIIIKYL